MMKGAAGSLPTVPCKTCHSAIFTAYAASVHGVIREHGMSQRRFASTVTALMTWRFPPPAWDGGMFVWAAIPRR